jgi:DNA polymerase I
MSNTLIIDTSYLIYRSYFAYPHLTYGTKSTGAIYGFIKTILFLIETYNPDILIFALDLPEPTWRHQVYPEYKAGRPPADQAMIDQINPVIKWVKSITSNVFAFSEYEADDIIATCALKCSNEKDNQVYIFSSDRDLYQLLIYPKIKFITEKGLFDASNLVEKYSVEAKDWVFYKTLIGDNSDNIKGISGIGPKTAAEIIRNFNSLEQIINYTPSKKDLSARIEKFLQQIKDNSELINLNYKLCSLNQISDLNLDKSSYNLINGEWIYDEYNFKSLKKSSQSLPEKNLKSQNKDKSTSLNISPLF